MGDVVACWNNAVVERFIDSLKHDWTANKEVYEARCDGLHEILQLGATSIWVDQYRCNIL